MTLQNRAKSVINARAGLAAGLICALLILGLSRGGFSPARADPEGGYYQRLSQSFLSGQLHLDQQVPEALLEAANPYDPEVSAPFRTYGIHDAILWEGKFYYYWSPGPVIFVVLPASLMSLEVTEADIGLWSLLGVCVVVGLILDKLGRRRRETILITCVISLSFSSIFLVTRLAVWEAGVLFALFWSAVALFFLTLWLHSRSPHWLYLSSLGIAIATSSRPESAFMLAPIIVMLFSSHRQSLWRRILTTFSLVTPVLLVVVCLVWYNKLRFGSFLDFGVTKLIGGLDQSSMKVSSIGYLPTNLANYLIRPLDWTRNFPFVELNNAPLAISKDIAGTEVVVGQLWTHFWIVPLLAIVLGRMKLKWTSTQFRVGLLVFAAGIVQLLFVSVAIFGSSERYRTIPDLLMSLGIVIAFLDLNLDRSKRSLLTTFVPLCVSVSLLGAAHGYYPDRVPQNAVISSMAGLLSPLEGNKGGEKHLGSISEHDGCTISVATSSNSSRIVRVQDIEPVARARFVLTSDAWNGFGPLFSFGTQGASDVFGISWDGDVIQLLRDRWRETPSLSIHVHIEPGVVQEIVVSRSASTGVVYVFLNGVHIYQSDRPLLSDQITSWGVNSLNSTAVFGDLPVSVDVVDRSNACEPFQSVNMEVVDLKSACLTEWSDSVEGLRRRTRSLTGEDLAIQIQVDALPIDDVRYPVAVQGVTGAGDLFMVSRTTHGIFVYHDHWGTPITRSSLVRTADSALEIVVVREPERTRVFADGLMILTSHALYETNGVNNAWRVGKNDIGASTAAIGSSSVNQIEISGQCNLAGP